MEGFGFKFSCIEKKIIFTTLVLNGFQKEMITHLDLWREFHFDVDVPPRAASHDVCGHAVVSASVLLAHAVEHEHVALIHRRVGRENGVVLPPPVDLGRRIPARIALQLNPL